MPASKTPELHIDIETYSSEDLTKVGVYRYVESIDFEILLFAYAFDDEEVECIVLAEGEELPERVTKAINDKSVHLCAHNAAFERICLNAAGLETSISRWYCSAVKSAYLALPRSLKDGSEVLDLGNCSKADYGKTLINFFSKPIKPTKRNGFRSRNLPHHNREKWDLYIQYNIQDVIAEREIGRLISKYTIPTFERQMYILDQEINDRGVLVHHDFVSNAIQLREHHFERLSKQLLKVTRLANPNSVAQLKKWIESRTGIIVKSLSKDTIPKILDKVEDSAVREALQLRSGLSLSSLKKYDAALISKNDDDRARGLFNLYGASRTARWAGQRIQLQNLKQNHINLLDEARDAVLRGDYSEAVNFQDKNYDGELEDLDIASLLSQLIRTSFIAGEGKTFLVADFSAIEARVIAWLADEQWRLDVFNGHGKIYEASAAKMFGVPVESISKSGENYGLRAKGKVAELALGFGGGLGAVRRMPGGNTVGNDSEVQSLIDAWRRTSPNIVKLWNDLEKGAIEAMSTRRVVNPIKHVDLSMKVTKDVLQIKLPSGRKMTYWHPGTGINRFGGQSITYWGMGESRKWMKLETYGGKLTENIVQAIARDIMALALTRLNDAGYPIVMHVHDEAVIERPLKGADKELEKVCEIMGAPVEWAEGLPLGADGYVTPYYKKD